MAEFSIEHRTKRERERERKGDIDDSPIVFRLISESEQDKNVTDVI